MTNVPVKKFKILLVDDHPASRKWVIYFLNNSPGIKKFGEAENGAHAIAELEKESYDIIYLDIQMPGMDGLETAVVIKKRFPKSKIILFSMAKCKETIIHLLAMGIESYIVKEEEEIIKAFEEVSAGRKYFSPNINRVWMENEASKLSHSANEIMEENSGLMSKFGLFFTSLKSRIF